LENKELTRIEEEAQVPWKQMIVNLGGALSLFMGMSFVTMIEVAEMTAEAVAAKFSNVRIANGLQ
jgi:hypothetical protein